MAKKLICLLLATSTLGAIQLRAEEGTTANEGTLNLNKKTYALKRAMAYETTVDNEDAIGVVLSNQPVASEKLQEARTKEKEGGDPDFQEPYLRLIFKKTGEFKHWSAGGGGTSLSRHSGKATGELKMQDGKVVGKGSQPIASDDSFPMAFDAKFDVALLKAGDSLPPSTARKSGPAANVKPTVTGVFKGNDKDAKLAYASARWVEPFADKAGIELVFTEKDHTKAKKPGFDAMFGKFGSALVISLHEDGRIYGCQVSHTGNKKQGFSSVGQIEATEFTYEDGKVEGEIATNGQLEFFGDTWEVKIKFVAPLGEIPKEFQVAEEKKPEKETQPTAKDSEDADDEEPATTAASGPKASELALTKDATDVQYKALVHQLSFKSKSTTKSVCTELTAGLKAQGWKTDGRDLVNPNSSILTRKQGKASLTIFVKPADGGSEVKMMTDGLSWDDQ